MLDSHFGLLNEHYNPYSDLRFLDYDGNDGSNGAI